MKNKKTRIILAGFLALASFAPRSGAALAPVETAVPAAEAPKESAPVLAGGEHDLISVEFHDADIQSAFKILALKGNVNIVASPEVQGKITMDLTDVPWLSAFETIVNTYGFSYEKKDNIYQILTAKSMQEKVAGEKKSGQQVFTLDYASIDQVTAALKKNLAASAVVEPIAGSNQIVVTDDVSKLEAVGKLISEIDRKMPQVHIETKIVRTTLNKGEKMGIDWNPALEVRGAKRPFTYPFSPKATGRFLSNKSFLPIGQTASESTITTTSGGGQNTATEQDFPTGVSQGFPFVQPEDFKFGTVDFNQFSAMFNMLSSRQSTKIISNPRIVVMNHQAAQIQVGDEIGIPKLERNETTGAFEVTGFESRNTGIVLKVTPHISKQSDVMLKVRPEVTKFIGFEPITNTNLTSPHFETVVAETTVIVHSGDTLVIGGLISDEDSEAQNKVPYLSRLPVAGWMFKSHNPSKVRTETIFFITVTLADDVYNKKALKEWTKSQKDFKEERKDAKDEFENKKPAKPQAKKAEK